MQADVPRAVLSDHFSDLMSGKRLLSAVFLTFQLDPGFFELQILPVFLDTPVSHADRLRSFQLEEALRGVRGHVAVYYDAHGLVPGSISAKLDIRRIPMRRNSGVFHPKNVFLLVEEKEAADGAVPARSLLVASLSANLTRSGWWQNVEVCHVERIDEGSRSLLRDDLLEFLGDLKIGAGARRPEDHAAVDAIRDFLKRSTESRTHASTGGRLHPRFFEGKGNLLDFLTEAAGSRLRGLNLEVISPYVDDAPSSAPLEAMIEAFRPASVRVYLPRDAEQRGAVREDLYTSVRKLPDVTWGKLPKDLLRQGQGNETKPRFVHAKVYRFFDEDREILLIGSPNLTNAAHKKGGNLETAYLVESSSPKPGFWMTEDKERPPAFEARSEEDAPAASGGSKLELRYAWDTGVLEGLWTGSSPSPELRLVGGGVEVGHVPVLPPQVLTPLPESLARSLAEHLTSRSLFEVEGEAETPTLLLVQEEGMAKKPSQLFSLTAAEILRYWALLTAEQRAAFLEAHAPTLGTTEEGLDLVTRAKQLQQDETFFDRFAGVFHAFSCLERAVKASLTDGDGREARYRLFGKKYDSLGTLLDCLLRKEKAADPVLSYVTVLCAKQLCDDVAREHGPFWKAPENGADELLAVLEERHELRTRLAQQSEEMPSFLDWFDTEFLRRAKPLEAAS